ncbi:hypothetical protein [Foetidibacter luteolus]|uniref:hypothetical protein n=1 Tax=Foetidibacter luteolus TaxID=2608880 RepID=UPI00129B7EFC|nr:hypothetical protein [Foetidibacter luteolus]
MLVKKLCLVLSLSCAVAALCAQGRRVDTTVTLGKTGYKVFCNNKNADKNDVSIKPVGFENTVRDVTIPVRGRVNKTEVDDLNADGFPELLLYVYSGEGGAYGTVLAITSEKNQGMRPIYFPDILDDQKLKEGYRGQDHFMLLEGMLIRRFPVFNTSDTANIKPTGVTRGIQYNIVSDENGQLKFKILRSYEAKQ